MTQFHSVSVWQDGVNDEEIEVQCFGCSERLAHACRRLHFISDLGKHLSMIKQMSSLFSTQRIRLGTTLFLLLGYKLIAKTSFSTW